MIIKEVQGLLSARDWNRTSTSLRTADFESAASTNSATRALFFIRVAILSHRNIAAKISLDIFSCNSILHFLTNVRKVAQGFADERIATQR